jgi:hypothetical protein
MQNGGGVGARPHLAYVVPVALRAEGGSNRALTGVNGLAFRFFHT